MGNQITKDFELTGGDTSPSSQSSASAGGTRMVAALAASRDRPTPIGTGGPGNLFSIYQARKKSTGQPAAVFLFEKQKYFDGRRHLSKSDQERICETLKREAEKLARLRHPCVLEIAQGVAESSDAIAYATEPLLGSLASLLHANNTHGANVPSSSHMDDAYELDELEIQKGLLQLAKGLAFCHNDAKMIHGNLCPESVYVNVKGDFKLGGFSFAISTQTTSATTPSSMDPSSPGGVLTYPYDMELPTPARANMDYLAPECLLDRKVQFASDTFALGCLIYALFHRNVPSLVNTRDNLQSYKTNLERIPSTSLQQIPQDLRDITTRMLSRNPSERPTASAFQACPYFDNLLMSTIKYLETIVEQTVLQKSQFFKGLTKILAQFPRRALVNKILPALLEELKDHTLVPVILPCIFYIVEKLEPVEFQQKCLPALKPVFSIRDPTQCAIVLLNHMELVLRKSSPNVIKDEITPLLMNLLDQTTNPPVVQRTLKILPEITGLLDFSTVKNSLFPRIQTLCIATKNIAIRVQVLVCFHALLKQLDKFTLVEKLLPTLKEARETMRHPAVYFALLAVYDELGRSYLEGDLVAGEVLPELWKMAVETVLNVEQFKKLMRTIHELGDKVETQHLKRLEELRQLDRNATQAGQQATSPQQQAALEAGEESVEAFEALVGHRRTAVAPSVSQPTLPPRPVAANAVPMIPVPSETPAQPRIFGPRDAFSVNMQPTAPTPAGSILMSNNTASLDAMQKNITMNLNLGNAPNYSIAAPISAVGMGGGTGNMLQSAPILRPPPPNPMQTMMPMPISNANYNNMNSNVNNNNNSMLMGNYPPMLGGSLNAGAVAAVPGINKEEGWGDFDPFAPVKK